MPKSRVEAIIPQLTEAFEHCRARVFNFADIESLRLQNQDTWELPPSTSNARFLKQLIQHTPMQKFELRFPSKTRTLYAHGQVPLLERLSFALPTAYMSHATACYLNKLTPTLPTAIYLNDEQSHASSETAQLSQDRIDAAFQRPQRMPSQIADVEGHTVHLCSGRNRWNLGLTNIEWNVQDEARVITLPSTTLERTLIDIAVRPSHVGGVANVLTMYRATDGSANIAIMAELLEAIGFIYPYRQAIGFLLDRTGLYPDEILKCLENPPFEFDFYLGHAMTHTRYVSRWRLHVPLEI